MPVSLRLLQERQQGRGSVSFLMAVSVLKTHRVPEIGFRGAQGVCPTSRPRPRLQSPRSSGLGSGETFQAENSTSSEASCH